MAEDYRWPEDSPFVRVPKSALSRLNVPRPVSNPGVLKRVARELLGLTSQERQQAEEALQRHLTAVDALVERAVFETNRPTRLSLPGTVLASQMWVVSPLGDEVKTLADELQTALRTSLGQERWPMVQAQLETGGTHSLRRVLNLDTGGKPQELGVWLSQREDDTKITVGYGWAGDYASFSSRGVALEMFLPNAPPASSGGESQDPLAFLGGNDLPTPLVTRLRDWLQSEALRRLGKESTR
jgi:hypothetical protein